MKIIAFLFGIFESRRTFSTYYGDMALDNAYDRGRDFAHKFTLRKYEY